MSKPSLKKYYKTLSRKQLDLVVGAISEGQYSWACFLLLKFSGYNPLQFIPYRTYNRLVKKVQDNTELIDDRYIDTGFH